VTLLKTGLALVGPVRPLGVNFHEFCREEPHYKKLSRTIKI
jgi:hypothetical protein